MLRRGRVIGPPCADERADGDREHRNAPASLARPPVRYWLRAGTPWPRPANTGAHPGQQLVAIEADVTTEPHVRDTIGARLSEQPRPRHVEQLAGAGSVEQRRGWAALIRRCGRRGRARGL